MKIVTMDQLPNDVIWNVLWPNREYIPVSMMKYLGGHIMYDTKPTFLAAYVNDVLVGINSCHPTVDGEYRSRGLYVYPAARGNGLAVDILKATSEFAFANGATSIWSYPREMSLRTYLRAGYIQTSDFIQDQFGMNCYVIQKV